MPLTWLRCNRAAGGAAFRGQPRQRHRAIPGQPQRSPDGITAVTSADGRATIMMPHPERVFRTVGDSWHPDNWGEDGAWMRMFRNARKQLG
ncbi:phosphoribosylformylglycinamidine synthase subunit PurQ [Shigella flexneri]